MKTPTPRSARTVLCLAAWAACLPYLALKTAWVSGSHIGIPEGSPLREGGGLLAAANALGVVLDSCVVVLALALVRPWGARLPAWLMLVPLWAATGFLSPILIAFPVQSLHAAVAGGGASSAGSAGTSAESELLDSWVWTTVYTGFVLQALALGALFVLYGRARWRSLIDGPVRPAGRPESAVRPSHALLGSLGALLPGAVHAMWAAGLGFGLDHERRAAYDADTVVTEASFTVLALLAAAGLLLAAGRRGGGRLLPPLVLVWTGSGALACWGGWLLLNSLAGVGGTLGKQPTAMMCALYAGQMLVGLGIAAFGARLLTRRAAYVRADAPVPSAASVPGAPHAGRLPA